MTQEELFGILATTDTVREAVKAVEDFVGTTEAAKWVPLGGRKNNRGTVEVATNTGRALVERITNGIDAVLENECDTHSCMPLCRSPREAASAWLNVPLGGLSSLSAGQRRHLANLVVLRMAPGEGPESRIVDILDRGTGLMAAEMPKTILGLNEDHKITKHYLAGTYGQGGSATFAACELTMIASRRCASDPITFTVIQFLDLPPEQFKTGRYVYLVVGDELPQTSGDDFGLEHGTRCRHFGYDLTKFKSPVGPNSVYGLLQQVLFDPVMPIWFDNRVHNYRRVIKGARNALNGAVDEGDDQSRGPQLDHNMKMFYVSLGDLGRIGIEYWVLLAPEKSNKRPIAAFVDPAKPIILTYNGQNQHEISALLVRKYAELPYLAQRLICHVDCDHLTPQALRSLFASGREEARRGQVYDTIESELIRVLRSDDTLADLNTKAKEGMHRRQDESARETMRKEVARLLKVQGFEVSTATGVAAGGEGVGDRPRGGKRGARKIKPIELKEPPTYIRIVAPEDEAIEFYPEQRRYIRVETDANSNYHDPSRPNESRINVVVEGDPVHLAGTTALQGGRMRILVDCGRAAKVGSSGAIQVELQRPGMPTLSDRRNVSIVNPSPVKEKQQRIQLPPFDVRPVPGLDSQEWIILDWPDNANEVASSAVREDGLLVVYYSTVFPRYLEYVRKLERRDPMLAVSFTSRYEIWLAVHSLILDEDQRQHERPDGDSTDEADLSERRERCRIAILSALFAAREVSQPACPVED